MILTRNFKPFYFNMLFMNFLKNIAIKNLIIIYIFELNLNLFILKKIVKTRNKN